MELEEVGAAALMVAFPAKLHAEGKEKNINT
jgi:hypothetical protein